MQGEWSKGSTGGSVIVWFDSKGCMALKIAVIINEHLR